MNDYTIGWGLSAAVDQAYNGSGVEGAKDTDLPFEDLEAMKNNIDDIILPAMEKMDALGEGGVILGNYELKNPGATLEDFLRDPDVSDEDKQKVILALVIEQNPGATPAEIDELADQLWNDVKDDGNLSTESYDKIGFGPDSEVSDVRQAFGKRATEINTQTFNEETMLLINQYQVLLQAMTDIMIKVNQIIGQTFQKATQ